MTKQKFLKKLRRNLRALPAREREDLVSYYDELIEDSLERGKTEREIFSELASPDKIAEDYCRERVSQTGEGKERGHVRETGSAFGKFARGLLLGLLDAVLAILFLVFAAVGLSLVVAAIYILAVSFGVLFAGHAAIFFAQIAISLACFAAAGVCGLLCVLLVKAASALRSALFRRRSPIRIRKTVLYTAIASAGMLLAAVFVFTASFACLGFDYRDLAVTEDLAVHEEVLEASDSLTLQADNLAVTVIRSEDEQARFVYRDFPESPKQFSFADGKAEIGAGNGTFSVLGATFSMQWRRGLFIGAAAGDLQSAELYLPASFTGDLGIEVINGSVSISDMVFSDLVAETKNGAIYLKNVTAETVTVETTNGMIKLQNIAAGSVGAETTNGMIKFDDVRAETVKMEAKTGAIILNEVACTRVHAATSTGEISLKDLRADFISLHTSTGTVSGTVAGREEDYTITASCNTGSCNLHDRQGGTKQLDVRVSTGSVNIKFIG